MYLDKETSHYLIRVLRAKAGDLITVFNGDGYNYQAIIVEANPSKSFIDIQSSIPNPLEPKKQLHLYQGMAAGQKMKWIIQKATELGVTSLTPVITTKTKPEAIREFQKKEKNLEQITVSAAMQCGRSSLLKIEAPLQFSVAQAKHASHRFVLSPYAKSSLLSNTNELGNSIELWVGPESGFTEQEINSLIDHQAIPVLMGPRILRTETAAISGCTILQAMLGEL